MKLRTALLASTLILTPALSLAAPAHAAPDSRYQIRITGTADPFDPVAPFPGYTELKIPVTVRCPAGQIVGILDAGLPIFFPPPDRRAVPYLPGNTAPTRVVCTGKWVTSYAYARSTFRGADPALQPTRFIPGSRLIAHVALYGKPAVTDTKTVRVQLSR